MDWREYSRSRSRVAMDWRASSRSRSRPPRVSIIQGSDSPSTLLVNSQTPTESTKPKQPVSPPVPVSPTSMATRSQHTIHKPSQDEASNVPFPGAPPPPSAFTSPVGHPSSLPSLGLHGFPNLPQDPPPTFP